MPHFSPDLAALIARRHGAIRHHELIADGFGPAGIRRMITAEVLVAHHRGTYRVHTAPNTFEFRCAAASLAEPSAIVTGSAAGRLWEFRHVDKTELPIVLRNPRRQPAAGLVRLRTGPDRRALRDADRVGS